jgi:hypothetical protein
VEESEKKKVQEAQGTPTAVAPTPPVGQCDSNTEQQVCISHWPSRKVLRLQVLKLHHQLDPQAKKVML